MQVFGPLQQGIAAGASVFEVLDTPAEDAGGSRPLARARGEVEYRDVHFKYVEEKGPVLRGISLRAPVGSTLAIVGKSGSGKSTLVSLFPRFYDPQEGSVVLDGVDVREYALADLRRQVALVSQDVVLFNDTIRNNIAFSTADATPQAVEDAARAAYVLEFADELPQGLDTMVGDRGALLSGGQRQRIAIARAILKDAPVLILDEATSSLDTHSERRIQAALAQLARNRTTLVIAHRLSTVEQADHIVVLDDGAVVEAGTHSELLAHGGLYAQLYRLQFSA
jgi:subfamily B ATP-binding cassette protein MsbA